MARDRSRSRSRDRFWSKGEPRSRAEGRKKPMSRKARAAKQRDIEQACGERDVAALSRLALTEDGLLSHRLRRRAWPILLGLDECDGVPVKKGGWAPFPSDDNPWIRAPEESEGQDRPSTARDIVTLDVKRATQEMFETNNKTEIDRLQQGLVGLINDCLDDCRPLEYYQGYHDVAQVVMMVMGSRASARPVLSVLSVTRLRDSMVPSDQFPTVINRQMEIILSVISETDARLAHAIRPYLMLGPLAGLLTLYARSTRSLDVAARLFDFGLSQPAVIQPYLFAALVLKNRSTLGLSHDCETDELMLRLHELSKTTWLDDPDETLEFALELLSSYPVEKLIRIGQTVNPRSVGEMVDQATKRTYRHLAIPISPPVLFSSLVWDRISAGSVLKTTLDESTGRTHGLSNEAVARQSWKQTSEWHRDQLVDLSENPVLDPDSEIRLKSEMGEKWSSRANGIAADWIQQQPVHFQLAGLVAVGAVATWYYYATTKS